MEQPEHEWLAQYRSGQVEGLERLVEHYRRPLFGFILRMTEGRDDADEIFQEVWFRVIKHQEKYKAKSFTGWLFRIAHNLVIDRARKRKPIVDLQAGNDEEGNVIENRLRAPGIDPAEAVGGRELGLRIREEVEKLPAEQREVYLMRMEAQLSFKEIAKIQETSVNTALGRMHYAIGKLREALKSEYEMIRGDAAKELSP